MGKLGRPTEVVEAAMVAGVVLGLLKRDKAIKKAVICGSVRRARAIVSDVDIMVVADIPDLTALRPATWDVHWTPKGGVAEIDDVRVELYLTPPHGEGCMLQFLTGPGEFNVYLRQKAKRLGMKLSQYGLIDSATGERLDTFSDDPFFDEIKLFEQLDVPWIEPHDRDDWRQIVAHHKGRVTI